MLKLSQATVDALVRQAMDAHPIECCGIIAARHGDNMSYRLIPMRNAADSEHFFEFDAIEQLRIWREMDEREELLLVIYHSHTHSIAYPSKTDIEYAAAHPDALHLIIATDPRFKPSLRCYRIVAATITEEYLSCLQE